MKSPFPRADHQPSASESDGGGKRILIMSVSTGSGHVRAAEALEKEFAHDPRVAKVIHADALKFTKDGNFVKSWGQTGSAQGQFNNIRGIASDAAGNLYVADTDNHCIRKITPAGDVSTFAGAR